MTRVLRRILLVEDDRDIQDVTSLLLSEVASFEVRACESASEALQTAPGFAPDLILLDVMMPDMDGEAAFAALRLMPATAATPVIFLTARVQPSEIAKYRALGSLGVIPKPYDPNTLAETIQGMWDRHQTAQITEARRGALGLLRQRYAEELPERLEALEGAAGLLQEHGWDAQVVASLYEMAHRLAGSAAIYGFPAVSEAAQRVGSFATQRTSGATATDAKSLLKLVDALLMALEQEARLSRRVSRAEPKSAPKRSLMAPRRLPLAPRRPVVT